MVTVDVPSTDVELICSMPLIVFTESSTRLVMSVSTSSADAPGLLTLTDTVGKSILGNRSTPKVKNEKPPTTMSATISMVAKTGRLTQSSASLCTGNSPGRSRHECRDGTHECVRHRQGAGRLRRGA